jgi:hypothetical protein
LVPLSAGSTSLAAHEGALNELTAKPPAITDKKLDLDMVDVESGDDEALSLTPNP